ncbi:hypothetical protein GGI20_000595 [Coemansia sp. BCRC 34301]|nr:hypothetical protein GGI20_000595 [Coemansia sp. BCRC 34301]
MNLSNSEFKQTLLCARLPHSTGTGYTDKLYLPPSSLTALLDSRTAKGLSGGDAAVGSRRQQAFRHSPFGNEEADHFASSQTDLLPSPLIFRLQAGLPERQRNARSVHCGVREFSHEEGQAGIPEWLMDEMGLTEGEPVSIELVRLQKGTHAQLQALNSIPRVGDLRSLLEAYMRTKLTALTIGETLLVPVSGIAEPLSFRVAALEPTDAVDIVDTDLSVDIVYSDLGLAVNQPAVDHSSSGDIRLVFGVGIDVDVTSGQTRAFTLHFPAETNSADVTLDCRFGDASLVASSLVQYASLVDNTWYDYSAPSHKLKKLHITRDQLLPQGSNTVHVSVVGFTALCQARISVEFDRTHDGKEDAKLMSLGLSSENDMQVCANCGSSVPTARFDMHRIVCERHNIKCAHCDSIFKRGSDDAKRHWHCKLCNASGDVDDRVKHLHFFHTPASCTCDPALSAFASVVELAEHRRTKCPERLIECRYCHNVEPQGPASSDFADIMDGLYAHEAYCGNRTIECTKCKAHVRIRQVLVHMRMHQVRVQDARDNMVPCANKECNRERAQNPLGLCTSCFGPFYTGQHDPDNHKLLKRLARTLHTQLTRGCGIQRCHNPMCATGIRNSSPAAPALSQTEAAALMVPVLKAYTHLSTLQRPNIDFAKINLHLCT